MGLSRLHTALSVQKSTLHANKLILGFKDLKLLQSMPLSSAGQQLVGFKYIYMNNKGTVSYLRGQQGTNIEIAGSPGTNYQSLFVAASYLKNITKHMPVSIFYRLASETSLGIFSAREKLTVFPEWAHLANGHCGPSCTGLCAHTCSGDGRKIEDLAGIGGRRAVILKDNVLCSNRDPYRRKENILAHEFTHTIHKYALSEIDKAKIKYAFRLARQRQIWNMDSYAMSNPFEYFAEGATVFFGVNRFNRFNTGGMNLCGSEFCRTEEAARINLLKKDGRLFDVLSYVFTDLRPILMSCLSVCPLRQ